MQLGHALIDCLNKPANPGTFWAVTSNYLLTERHVYLVPTKSDQTVQQRFYQEANETIRERGPAQLLHAFDPNQRVMAFCATPQDMCATDWYLILVSVVHP